MTFRHGIAAFRRKLEVSLVKHPLEAACGRASLELSVLVDVRSIDAVDILDLQVRPEALFLHVDGAEPRDLVGNADVTKVALRLGRGEVAKLTKGIAMAVSKVVDAALVDPWKASVPRMLKSSILKLRIDLKVACRGGGQRLCEEVG